MGRKDNQGEGNREADREYRRHVKDTVEHTSDKERSRKARELDDEELSEARQAEEKGRTRARE